MNGFGYDPHFYLPDLGMTAAELPLEQKNILSHRARALRGLLQALRSEFDLEQAPVERAANGAAR